MDKESIRIIIFVYWGGAMRRWPLAVLVAVALLTLSFVIFPRPDAQPRIRMVGVLAASDFRLDKLAGLREALSSYGFVEGENTRFLVKNARGNRQKLRPLAEELVREGVEVIITTGRVETEAAKDVTREEGIPLVFMGLTAVTQDNLVEDLLRPRQGITGVHNDHAALSGKRLELLAKLLPQADKFLVIYDPTVVPTGESLAAVRSCAQKLQVALAEEPVTNEEELRKLFERQLPGIDGVLLLPSFFLESAGVRTIVPLAREKGLPVMGVEYAGPDSGLFAVYGVTPYDQGRQAARILAKVLRGQRVGDIPVEPPAELHLIVDAGVARQLGLRIETSVLGYADLIYSRAGDADAQ